MPSQEKETFITMFSIENKSKTEIADDFSVTDFYDKLSSRLKLCCEEELN